MGDGGRALDATRLDAKRLAAVRATGLLDSEVEEAFDRLTRLAVRLVGVPAAFISLVDENRDFYKSACGFGESLASARELSGVTFCHYTIQSPEPLVIPDTRADPRYRDVPTVTSLGVAAYVGIPLVLGGEIIGAFCAIDMEPRRWSTRDIETLTELAHIAVNEIDLRGVTKRHDTARIAAEASRKAMENLNAQPKDQATALEAQTQALPATTEELQVTTEELNERTTAAEVARDHAENALKALARSEAQYRLLTDAVPVQVWTATPDGALDYVSERTIAYFGVPPALLLGIGWTTFLHPDDLQAAAERWSHSTATGEPYQAEFRLRDSTGEYRWHLARALPQRDASGQITSWTGSNTDVEAERRARANAEAANRSKSEFLAMMSHELRTPLNAIGGYAELIELGIRGPVTEPQLADLTKIQRSQRHLLGLINGILNYAKIDAGKLEYSMGRVPMWEIVSLCESFTLPQLRDKQLTLKVTSCARELHAWADREKVQQILLNLVGNAVKFTDAGGSIEIRCESDPTHVIVHVTDTGRGIAPEQIERIFQPFVQIDANLTRDSQGTGLGLAISRDLARGMGGDIMATSTLGAGSTFTLILPLPA